MHKIGITIIALLVSGVLFAQDEVFKAVWASTPVKIDGNPEEWSQPLRYYDEDTKLFFAFSNDNKNIYICFQTADDINQMKILHAGMEISLSIKGEHKATIDFPLPQNMDTVHEKLQDNGEQNRRQFSIKNNSLFRYNTMEAKGFLSKNGIIPINDSSVVHIAIGRNADNKFTYELCIPFNELYSTPYNAEDLSKSILMSVKINAMKGNSHSAGSVNRNFSAKNNDRTSRGGMHHGGNRNPDETTIDDIKQDKTDTSKKTSFKQRFILARSN